MTTIKQIADDLRGKAKAFLALPRDEGFAALQAWMLQGTGLDNMNAPEGLRRFAVFSTDQEGKLGELIIDELGNVHIVGERHPTDIKAATRYDVVMAELELYKFRRLEADLQGRDVQAMELVFAAMLAGVHGTWPVDGTERVERALSDQ